MVQEAKGHVDVQIKLSKNRLFDAYLIKALQDYREKHGRKLNALFSKLIANDMQDRASGQRIVLPSLGKFTLKMMKDKRIGLQVTDAEQILFLEEEIRDVMLLSEYAKKLFLQYFYGETEISEVVFENRLPENAPLAQSTIAVEDKDDKEISKPSKPIIAPKSYVKKKVVKDQAQSGSAPEWIM